MSVKRSWKASNPLTIEFTMQKWLKITPQTSPETYYLPRYSIPKFSPESTMVNVLLHRCCAARIDSSRKIRPLWLCKTVHVWQMAMAVVTSSFTRSWRAGPTSCTAIAARKRRGEVREITLTFPRIGKQCCQHPDLCAWETSETLIYLISTKIMLLILLKWLILNGGS